MKETAQFGKDFGEIASRGTLGYPSNDEPHIDQREDGFLRFGQLPAHGRGADPDAASDFGGDRHERTTPRDNLFEIEAQVLGEQAIEIPGQAVSIDNFETPFQFGLFHGGQELMIGLSRHIRPSMLPFCDVEQRRCCSRSLTKL